MKLYNELTTILPFYENQRNQDRFKENVAKNCALKVWSPSDALLPFIVRLPAASPKPTGFNLVDLNGDKTDLMNNIGKLRAYDFEDFAYCYYKGDALTFKYQTFEQPLNLKGYFFIELIVNSISHFSEVFYMSPDIKSTGFADKFIKIEYSDEKDIEPIRYRNGFKQVVYLDSYIHTSEPEIEEEAETDGDGGKIPTFTKLTIKQKLEAIVPDFLKNALMTLQMHEDIEVFDQNKRQGNVDRIKVTPTPDEQGAYSSVEIVIETDILIKTECDENKTATNENLWI